MNNIHASYVYCILNIHTGRRYVGSTTNMSSRKGSHLYELRKHMHPSKVLQKEYIEYGEDSLRFFILEKIFTFDRKELFSAEQKWIDEYKPEYNVNELAGNHFHKNAFLPDAKKKSIGKRKGRIQSDEERRMRSELFQKRWSDPHWRMEYKSKLKKTPEQIEAIKKRVTGKLNGNWGTKRPKEFGKMISDLFSSVEFTYISPAGEEVVFTNLSRFCEENDLAYHSMRSLHQGRRKSPYKGWTFKEKKFIGYKKER